MSKRKAKQERTDAKEIENEKAALENIIKATEAAQETLEKTLGNEEIIESYKELLEKWKEIDKPLEHTVDGVNQSTKDLLNNISNLMQVSNPLPDWLNNQYKHEPTPWIEFDSPSADERIIEELTETNRLLREQISLLSSNKNEGKESHSRAMASNEDLPVTKDISNGFVYDRPGRPHFHDDIWAWEEVNLHNRPKKEVYEEWRNRSDVEARNLYDSRRQFNRITKPEWGRK